jgi:hypothetical protein
MPKLRIIRVTLLFSILLIGIIFTSKKSKKLSKGIKISIISIIAALSSTNVKAHNNNGFPVSDAFQAPCQLIRTQGV